MEPRARQFCNDSISLATGFIFNNSIMVARIYILLPRFLSSVGKAEDRATTYKHNKASFCTIFSEKGAKANNGIAINAPLRFCSCVLPTEKVIA
jgi:hypothetical protein